MTTTTRQDTPTHLLPTSCYVCGDTPEDHGTAHPLWSNADADRTARAHDRRTTFVYPSGETTAEAHHVVTEIGR